MPLAFRTAAIPVGSRREFADNACVTFPAIGNDRHRTVFIDPGHGGPDPGATGTASDGTLVEEKTLTLTVGLTLVKVLRHDGYRVALSRIQDGPVRRLLPGSLSNGIYTPAGVRADLQARADCANAAHARLLLSLHFDAFADPTVGGVQTIYDPGRPFSGQSLRLAHLVQEAVLQAFRARSWDVPDRGIIPDTRVGAPTLTAEGALYGHLLELGPAAPGWLDRPSRMPGALTEPLFLTDSAEADIARSRAGQQTLAHALARAIEAYFRP